MSENTMEKATEIMENEAVKEMVTEVAKEAPSTVKNVGFSMESFIAGVAVSLVVGGVKIVYDKIQDSKDDTKKSWIFGKKRKKTDTNETTDKPDSENIVDGSIVEETEV